MFKKYFIHSPFVISEFPLHKKIKKDLLNKLAKSKGSSFKNKKGHMNDDLSKTDWPLSDNFERPWVKKYGGVIKDFLIEQAIHLGFTSISLSKIWFQQYKKYQTHGWHQHARNYTGVYYLEYPKGSEPTQFLAPQNLGKTFSLKVKEGDIIIFPSYIIHRSPPLKSNKRKTIISWNIDFEDIHPDLFFDREVNYLEDGKNGGGGKN